MMVSVNVMFILQNKFMQKKKNLNLPLQAPCSAVIFSFRRLFCMNEISVRIIVAQIIL